MTHNCELACHKLTFSMEERTHYDELRGKIFSSLVQTKELPNGYVFAFSGEINDLLHDLADWIPLEKKCCPFLDFAVTIKENEHVKLQLTGPEEVKEFLLYELQLV